MKSYYLLSIALLTLTACQKLAPKPVTGPTELITKITDANIGQPVAQFTYNGTQLTKAVTYEYASPITPANTYTTTTTFNYNAQGQLTGTTIVHSNVNSYDDVQSTVTYSGSNISSISFYHANNVLDKTITLTYSNGLLNQYFDPTAVKITYSYDNNGDNTIRQLAEYQLGSPDGNNSTFTNATFDSKNNSLNAFPLWFYFFASVGDSWIPSSPGKNNPVNSNDAGSAFSYSYQYDSSNYPIMISVTGKPVYYGYSYIYEYTKVN